MPQGARAWWDAAELDEERKFVKNHNDLNVGDEMYFIHLEWFQKWHKHVRRKTSSAIPAPGPISNWALLDPHWHYQHPKHNLALGHDYEVVTSEVWTLLHGRYHGGPTITHKRVDISGAAVHLDCRKTASRKKVQEDEPPASQMPPTPSSSAGVTHLLNAPGLLTSTVNGGITAGVYGLRQAPVAVGQTAIGQSVVGVTQGALDVTNGVIGVTHGVVGGVGHVGHGVVGKTANVLGGVAQGALGAAAWGGTQMGNVLGLSLSQGMSEGDEQGEEGEEDPEAPWRLTMQSLKQSEDELVTVAKFMNRMDRGSSFGSRERSEEELEEEVNFVKKNDKAKPGERWHFIHAGWLTLWKEYTCKGGPYPGPITNNTLLDPVWRYQLPLKDLRPVDDYRGVSPAVWKVLQEAYGGGPQITSETFDISFGVIDGDEEQDPLTLSEPGSHHSDDNSEDDDDDNDGGIKPNPKSSRWVSAVRTSQSTANLAVAHLHKSEHFRAGVETYHWWTSFFRRRHYEV